MKTYKKHREYKKHELDDLERGELAIKILLYLAAGVLGLALAATFIAVPGTTYIFGAFRPRHRRDRRRIHRAVVQLEKSGFVFVRKNKKGEEEIVITPMGVREARFYHLKQKRLPKTKKWDKKWRIVMFDIPEKKKKTRDAIRHALDEIGMRQLQKSVFIYPYECKEEIDFVAGYFEVRDDIQYVIADKVENERKLHRAFRV